MDEIAAFAVAVAGSRDAEDYSKVLVARFAGCTRRMGSAGSVGARRTGRARR